MGCCPASGKDGAGLLSFEQGLKENMEKVDSFFKIRGAAAEPNVNAIWLTIRFFMSRLSVTNGS